MPSRVIRGEINASFSLSQVSAFADLTFRALLVAVDDWGRIDGRLPVLKGLLFPARDEFTPKKIDGFLDELSAGDDPLILRYEVDGRPYIQLVKWEKHRSAQKRASASKLPEPIPGNPRISENPPEKSGPLTLGLGGSLGLGEGVAPPPAPRDAPASEPKAKVRKSRVPDQLSPDDRARVEKWAAAQKPPLTRHQLSYAWSAYVSKAKANGYRYEDQARAFMNAIGACGEPWALAGYTPPAGSPSSRYRSADDVLADAKRRQAEDDARASSESPEHVAKLIDLSLRQANGAA